MKGHRPRCLRVRMSHVVLCPGSRQAGEAAGPPGTTVAGTLEGRRPRGPWVRIFHVCYVAGCGTGTVAGAPPWSSQGRENRTNFAGSLGGPPALQ